MKAHHQIAFFFNSFVYYRFQRIVTHQRSEEHTSELQSRPHLVCRLLLEKKKKNKTNKQGVRKRIARTKRNCVNDGCTQPCSRRLSVDDCLACHLVRWTRIHSCTVTRADC